MMGSLRSPSLFWTFAGAFLLVLIGAALLQGLVIVTVIRPLSTRLAEDRAEVLVRRASLELESTEEAGYEEIHQILFSLRPEGGLPFLVFVDEEGWAIPDRPMPPPALRRIEDFLRGGAPSDTTGVGPRRGRRPGYPGRQRARPLPPDGERRPRGLGGIDPETLGRRLRVLSRQPVSLASGESGEIVALDVPPRFPIWPHAAHRPVLLFLPMAALLAGVAGLIMFRVLLRRIRALENLATRVTDGDLTARVAAPGSDEIGRLGSKLNFMTERLAEARRKIEESDRQRRRLLADISHELATPLTSIRGYTETLLNPEVSLSGGERSSYLRSVLDEAERMDLLIEDLLELTRLEAGAIPLAKERLDWTALCRNTMARYEGRFREAGLHLRWEGPVEEAWIVADGRRMEQVLENLLVNALRYVPSGGHVTLSLNPSPSKPPRYRLVVSDDGVGIPAEDLPHIFDRFYRVDPARPSGGSGLGLAIVREIVHRHGGSIRAEEREPAGLSILLEMPGPAEHQG
jgi:signal transduction histidine kinase